MHLFLTHYKTAYGIKISGGNYGRDTTVISVPLYAMGMIETWAGGWEV